MIFFVQVAIIVVSLISMFFNSLGIHLLRQIYSKEGNQDFILITLSATDIVIAMAWIAENVAMFCGYARPSTVWRVIYSSRTGFYLVWYAMMFFLTIDRFIGCNFPFRHRELTMKGDIRVAVATAWAFGIANSIIYGVLDTERVYEIFYKYIWVTLDGLYLCLFTVTYTSIFCKMNTMKSRHVRNRVRTGQNTGHDTGQQQFFKVISLILIAFVVFEIIPSIVNQSMAFAKYKDAEVSQNFIALCYSVNLLADPLIYIFLQKRARKLLMKMLRKLFKRRSTVYSFRDTSFKEPREDRQKKAICIGVTNALTVT